MRGFESAREADCEIKEAALSAGLCMTTKGAMFESDYTKADKALYYVKQNCKGSYFFYEQLLADNKENTNLSADLRNVAKLLKESGSYTGALDLNYREFARIYEFVNNVGDRHNHNCYLVMVTMNTLRSSLQISRKLRRHLTAWNSLSAVRSERWMSARATAQCSILSYYLSHRKIRFQMSWRESLCITMSSVTERISSRSMSISK